MSNESGNPDWRQAEWRWMLSDPAAEEFVTSAAWRRHEMVKVKDGANRAVYRCGDYFFKFDFTRGLRARFFPAAAAELRSAMQVERAGVPVVAYLGWGRSRFGTVLVTRGCLGGVNALDYWYRQCVYRGGDPDCFLNALERFLTLFLRSGLRHGDLHLGNLLYVERENRFVMVDVYKVHGGGKYSSAERLAALHLILDLRAGAPPSVLRRMLKNTLPCSEVAAGKALFRMLRAEALRLERDWPRRCRQIRSGYPKFSQFVRRGERRILIRKDVLKTPLLAPERFPEELNSAEFSVLKLEFGVALEQFLFSFWLQLVGVAHRRVVALEPDGCLYFEKPSLHSLPPSDREKVNALNEYLLCFELNLPDYDCWLQREDGRLFIRDFTPMLVSCPYRRMFQNHSLDFDQQGLR